MLKKDAYIFEDQIYKGLDKLVDKVFKNVDMHPTTFYDFLKQETYNFIKDDIEKARINWHNAYGKEYPVNTEEHVKEAPQNQKVV